MTVRTSPAAAPRVGLLSSPSTGAYEASGRAATRPLPGAASDTLGTLVTDPARPARVVAAFPSAVYIVTPESRVLAVVAADGLRLPNAVVIGPASSEGPFAAIRPGARALVGDGGVRAGPLAVSVVRRWAPPRARLPVSADLLERPREALGHALAAADHRPPAGVAAALGPLMEAADELNVRDGAAAAQRMLGLGPGLTPSGDDVLAGFLATLVQLCPEGAPVARFAGALGRRLETIAPSRTTALSAALLAHAARGEAVPELIGVLDSASEGRADPARLARLLRIGHWSGRDLARGAEAGLRVLAARAPGRARPLGPRRGHRRPTHEGPGLRETR